MLRAGLGPRYCSRDCQKAGWIRAHRAECPAEEHILALVAISDELDDGVDAVCSDKMAEDMAGFMKSRHPGDGEAQHRLHAAAMKRALRKSSG